MLWLHQLSDFEGEFCSVGCTFMIMMKVYSVSRFESLKQVIGWTVYWSLYFKHLRNMRKCMCQNVLGEWPLLPLLICEMLSSNLHLLAACLDWDVLCFSYSLRQMWGYYFRFGHNCSLILLGSLFTVFISFDAVYSEVLTGSLGRPQVNKWMNKK
jgi:hypothetical protein